MFTNLCLLFSNDDDEYLDPALPGCHMQPNPNLISVPITLENNSINKITVIRAL